MKPRWTRFLVPRADVAGWFGDGMHTETKIDGWCVEIAWLGLFVTFVIAREKSW